jgi:ribulose-phosphate 3-epimerase
VQSPPPRPLNDFHRLQPNRVDVTILAPSLLSADFARIAEQIACVQEAGAQYLHLDVMDGRFVPNITWGPKIIGDLRKLSPLVFDAHLMIVEPERYVDDFREAGCDRITFHLEATPHAQRLLVHLRSMGVKAGIAICPQTPVGMLQDVIYNCDTVLVMSVNPGFSGQKFIPHTIEKIREARALIDGRNLECLIEVDGGVGEGNARALVEAGADALVMGATVFGAPDPAAALRRIRALLA